MNDAEDAKRISMDQVERNANREWINLMVTLALQVSQTNRYFTSDDVMDAYHRINHTDKPTTHEFRAMGPVMLQAAKLGYCRKANCAAIPSRRRSLHASPRAVWESLVRQEAAQ